MCTISSLRLVGANSSKGSLNQVSCIRDLLCQAVAAIRGEVCLQELGVAHQVIQLLPHNILQT